MEIFMDAISTILLPLLRSTGHLTQRKADGSNELITKIALDRIGGSTKDSLLALLPGLSRKVPSDTLIAFKAALENYNPGDSYASIETTLDLTKFNNEETKARLIDNYLTKSDTLDLSGENLRNIPDCLSKTEFAHLQLIILPKSLESQKDRFSNPKILEFM